MILHPEDPNQMFFTSRADLVSEEPLVGCVDGVVSRLDLGALYARYSEGGAAFYDPGMQLRVLFFAYCDGVRSCREIAKRIRYDLRYQYFTGSLRPDFRTINRFRQQNLDLLPGYFVEIVKLCEASGLVDGSVLAIDGTKLRASSSGRRTWRRGKASALRAQIRDLLQSDVEGESSAESDEDLSAPGSSGSTPVSGVTDPDARFMKTSEGVLRSCYNAQVAVDNRQVIVAAEVSSVADDSVQYIGMVEQASEQLAQPVTEVLVDGGYYSGRALQHAAARGYDLYMPMPNRQRAPEAGFERDAFEYDEVTDSYRCPGGHQLTYRHHRDRNGVGTRVYKASSSSCGRCQYRTQCTKKRYRELHISAVYELERRMQEKLSGAWGRQRYTRRKHLVEPVFGNLKFNLHYDRFALRTLPKVRGEFLLMCLAHNLKKLAAWPQSLKPVSTAILRPLIRAFFGLCHLIRRPIHLDNAFWKPKPIHS